mgnify:CR=1 FL=1
MYYVFLLCNLGPHKNCQVITVRSLYGNWKFPIFIAFDQAVTKEIYNQILYEVQGGYLQEFGCRTRSQQIRPITPDTVSTKTRLRAASEYNFPLSAVRIDVCGSQT